MAFHYIKEADIKHEFVDGFSMTELLPGTHEAVRVYKCILKSGSSVKLDLYEDKFQVFAFSKGIGAIVSESNANSITEEAYFVPEFNKERVCIHAATDLVFIRYDVQHTEADRIDTVSRRLKFKACRSARLSSRSKSYLGTSSLKSTEPLKSKSRLLSAQPA